MTGRRTLEVADILDVSAAKRLGQTLSELGAGEQLVVDCRAVRTFEDRALALLAVALRESPGVISLRGLGVHQRRMLGYLGVEDMGRAGGGDHGDEDRSVPAARGAVVPVAHALPGAEGR